ncbi:unnamed protein product, partial [Choristocarpus tenellus]
GWGGAAKVNVKARVGGVSSEGEEEMLTIVALEDGVERARITAQEAHNELEVASTLGDAEREARAFEAAIAAVEAVSLMELEMEALTSSCMTTAEREDGSGTATRAERGPELGTGPGARVGAGTDEGPELGTKLGGMRGAGADRVVEASTEPGERTGAGADEGPELGTKLGGMRGAGADRVVEAST